MLSFFQKITEVLDEYNIPYMLSGSIALGLYTVPRMTRDIDFIVHLEAKNVDVFVNSFKDGFYCDKDGVKDAIKGPVKMFNIIDHASGYKADFVILKNDPFRQEEFESRIFWKSHLCRISGGPVIIEADLDTGFSIRCTDRRY
jgi:hypothetical protein